jgi:ABC-type xylose transport system substrate-binding protein
MREELTVLDTLFHMLAEKQVMEVSKETRELAQNIVTLESQLNVAMNDAETNASKNIDRFKK